MTPTKEPLTKTLAICLRDEAATNFLTFHSETIIFSGTDVLTVPITYPIKRRYG
jgi:hypothetical protein